MNQVTLVGRFTSDPELRYTADGKAVANWRLAVNSRGKGGTETTEFVSCSAWEKTAEKVADQGRKGTEAFVQGRLKTSEFEGRDGSKVRKTEVVASWVVIGQEAKRSAPKEEPRAQETLDIDDIPF